MQKIKTFRFGEVGVDDKKIITFPDGIIGFPDLKKFVLLHDQAADALRYLQSIDDPDFALTVVDPLTICDSYLPTVTEEQVACLGDLLTEEELLVFVTITIPEKIEDMSANLQAPIIINTLNNWAVQVILDDESYKVKTPIYGYLKDKKK